MTSGGTATRVEDSKGEVPVADPIEAVRSERARWEQTTLKRVLDKHPERLDRFVTTSSYPIRRLYTPDDIADLDFSRDLGFPGEYPYTRGVQPTMYRGRLWTMRQFAGFGTPEETNKRYKYLLEQGQTGLSVAVDFPTLYGYDGDHPMSAGEVGVCGVAVSSLQDMEDLFDGIPMGEITSSMTINSPAAMLLAFYIAAAEKQGYSMDQLGGTVQNDILKEYIAQKEFIFPPEPSMRLVTDSVEFAAKHMPRWNIISISGYHIREAGSTAVQELAFTLADGMEYVRWGVERGLDVDEFAPNLSFFFNAHNDLFEEVAKYRAARRIWSRFMNEEMGAKKPKSLMLRFHTQTAGCSATAEQPEINIVRTAVQGLAAVLGGTQSLHTNSFDEALALPTEKAVRIALRTQQIIAHESGVANTVDPLGGSYFIETLTNEMEEEAQKYFERIEKLGGVIPAIEKGFFQREIADAAFRYQREIESGERVIVGVNRYRTDEADKAEILKVDYRQAEEKQKKRLAALKAGRDQKAVDDALEALRRAAHTDENLMYPILAATKVYATLGEMTQVLRDEWGEYTEPVMF
ncbi:MAG: methylmalonyl-CoA mutase family protein [Euryarchaeota archaeon]|nr:methylmalonyl-CoA mutase family protein [Euryarchaeota archaeon]